MPLEKAGLQELAYTNVYDGIICMDAWSTFPPRLAPGLINFHRALRAGGHLYFTVEIADEAKLRNAYIAAKDAKSACSRGRVGI